MWLPKLCFCNISFHSNDFCPKSFVAAFFGTWWFAVVMSSSFLLFFIEVLFYTLTIQYILKVYTHTHIQRFFHIPSSLYWWSILTVFKLLVTLDVFCINFYFLKHGTKTSFIPATELFLGFLFLSLLKFCAWSLTCLTVSWSWTGYMKDASQVWAVLPHLLCVLAVLCVSPIE